MNLEEKILYNVLRAIAKGGDGASQAPDSSYLKGLETIGLIKMGWDTNLTEFGRSLYNRMDNVLADQHYNGGRR